MTVPGWDHGSPDPDEPRTYRVDRIVEISRLVEISSGGVSTSDEFDLIDYLSKHVKQVEALLSSVTATVAEVRANLIIALAEQLAGWARQIGVLEPPELRRELARIGAELSSMYPDG